MYFSYNSACGIYSLQYLLTLLMLFIWIFAVQSLLYWHIYSIYVSGEGGAGKFHLVSRILTMAWTIGYGSLHGLLCTWALSGSW